ncbi:MAG: signal peptidase II [Gemmatimonadota bacterium]|nr:signal peptidase II [Gemmatimonadota bacterium]
MQNGRSSDVEASAANPWIFWGVIIVVVALDVASKAMAVSSLSPAYTPHEIVGDFVRFTLAFNPGAAFGLNLGGASRWIFTALTLLALAVLASLYRATREGDFARVLALALVSAGAVGNLIDRIRWSVGVVDFIDVGIGDHRFWTFNVADSAVTVGAFLLGWVFLQQDREAARVAAAGDV